jgi:phage shock protein A
MPHEVQQLSAKIAQLTQLIDQLLERLTKLEDRTSALEETLADGKANSAKKSGGGSKAGSNSHPLLKVSQRRRSHTSL